MVDVCSKLDFKKSKLTQPEDVSDTLGIEIGALAPFGYDNEYLVIFDKRLLEQEQVFINAGVHDKTITLAPDDLLQLIIDL